MYWDHIAIMEKKMENNHSYLVYWGYFERVEKSLAVKGYRSYCVVRGYLRGVIRFVSHCGLLIEVNEGWNRGTAFEGFGALEK